MFTHFVKRSNLSNPIFKRALAQYFSFLLLVFLSFNSSAAVEVLDPYVRAMPSSAVNSGAFMLLKNDSDTSVKLLSAHSDAAKVVELHTHIKEDGMMKMRQVHAIEIKANGQTELKPGGLHIMLMGLTKPLVVGESVKLVLKFNNGSVQELFLPVKNIMVKHH